jgi:DNA polymerase III epsilon subunit-like protein
VNAEAFLERKIQQGPGHDSLEDSLACRDIADRFIKNLSFNHIYGPDKARCDVLIYWALDKPMEDGRFE